MVQPGDWVEFRHPHYKTLGHVARVARVMVNGRGVEIERPAWYQGRRDALRIEWERLIGYWPKGTKGKTPEKRRPVAPAA